MCDYDVLIVVCACLVSCRAAAPVDQCIPFMCVSSEHVTYNTYTHVV